MSVRRDAARGRRRRQALRPAELEGDDPPGLGRLSRHAGRHPDRGPRDPLPHAPLCRGDRAPLGSRRRAGRCGTSTATASSRRRRPSSTGSRTPCSPRGTETVRASGKSRALPLDAVAEDLVDPGERRPRRARRRRPRRCPRPARAGDAPMIAEATFGSRSTQASASCAIERPSSSGDRPQLLDTPRAASGRRARSMKPPIESEVARDSLGRRLARLVLARQDALRERRPDDLGDPVLAAERE